LLLSRTREIPSTFIAKVTVERGDEVMLWKVETKSDSARRSLGKALISWASMHARFLAPLIDSRTDNCSEDSQRRSGSSVAHGKQDN
jgi:hypothetical protein